MKDEIEKNSIEIGTEVKNINVLIVEDIPLNQLLMKTLLDDFGFQHESAENGAIAIEKLKKEHFDVVLMDIQMPVMNGFEATEYIRKTLDLKIPIIALTADVTTVDLKKCREVGMNDYIAKPVDEHILFRKIAAIINKSHHRKIALNKIELNEETLKKDSFTDLNYLHKITKSNPNLMVQMIQIYLTQTPIIIHSIKESLATKNWITLTAAAHKIVPSFAIVGINHDYVEVAKKIQNLSNAGQDTDEMKDLVLQLEQVCAQACAELEQELQNIKIKIQ
jgi:CheY-like chemotaxis protein